jgi:hypothetical protein
MERSGGDWRGKQGQDDEDTRRWKDKGTNGVKNLGRKVFQE